MSERLVLVTGATGYIGGRAVPYLLERGHRIRCMVRDPARLMGRAWHDDVEIVRGDVLRPETLDDALRGVSVAYYLVHSMAAGSDFHDRDLTAARNFGTAARAAGVDRIIFLGGLADGSSVLSEHLRSRQQTGDALREAGVPVTEFRAGVIVGSGSLSFEMIRYLAERVPVMICPKWVYTRTQPIGIRDVLAYLDAALDAPDSAGHIVEIGGADVITYGEMMMSYARVRGLRRWMLPVPVLTPLLSSYWVDLVTPIPAATARPLIEGLRNESVVRDPLAKELFPGIQAAGYDLAVERALATLDARAVETSWSDAHGAVPIALEKAEGMVVERRQRVVAATPERVFATFTGIGGKRGWLYLDWLWRIRGAVDRLVGGVGMQRGRRDPNEVRVGDALDFWRVEAVTPNRSMLLRAEMKVPGRAWLEFEVTAQPDGRALLTQSAFFAPKGLSGWLYWYALYPFHRPIFNGLIEQVGQRAER